MVFYVDVSTIASIVKNEKTWLALAILYGSRFEPLL